MKKEWILFPALAVTCMACENLDNRSNMKENPAGQEENESDRQITKNIQQAIAQDSSLSPDARQIKVTTQSGIVTLQGTVENNNEQDKILKIVGTQNGITRLDNRLNVKRAL